MKYTVLTYFEDLQDNGFRYKKGDEYPRNGFYPSEERIKELSSGENKRGKALIELEDRNHIATVSEPFSGEAAKNAASSTPEEVEEQEEKTEAEAEKKVKKIVKKTMKRPVVKAKNSKK